MKIFFDFHSNPGRISDFRNQAARYLSVVNAISPEKETLSISCGEVTRDPWPMFSRHYSGTVFDYVLRLEILQSEIEYRTDHNDHNKGECAGQPSHVGALDTRIHNNQAQDLEFGGFQSPGLQHRDNAGGERLVIVSVSIPSWPSCIASANRSRVPLITWCLS